jgi:DNA-binding MarR family transcriptional regulator
LCRRGLLTREDVEHDQRAVSLRLTPAGVEALAAADTAMTERLDAVLAHTSRPTETVSALHRLGTGLDRLMAQRLAQR